MIFGTNGWSLRNYGICLLVAFRCGLSGHGGAACASSLSLQEPTIPPQMKEGENADIRNACAEFLAATSEFYRTPNCNVRVLAARPLRARENWATELFGDYNPETMLIRVWMRTAVRKEI